VALFWGGKVKRFSLKKAIFPHMDLPFQTIFQLPDYQLIKLVI
jgi:hypothetical protein